MRSRCRVVKAPVLLVGFVVGAACSEPQRVVPVALSPAVAPLGAKGVGKVRFELEDGSVVFAGEASPTLAQSDAGAFGDRLFRLNEHNLLEACRYTTHGRVCELVAVAGGPVIGGNLSWITQSGTFATPGAGGFIANDFIRQGPDSGWAWGYGMSLGTIYHCTFDEPGGASCAVVPPTAANAWYVPLGNLVVADGAEVHDVLWIGIQSADEVFSGAQLYHVWRCTASASAPSVQCAEARLDYSSN